MCATKKVPDLVPLPVTQEVLSPLQRWLEMGKNWDFSKRRPSSLRKNSHPRRSRKVGAQMSSIISNLSSLLCNISPSLLCVCSELSVALFYLVTFPKYITPAIHP